MLFDFDMHEVTDTGFNGNIERAVSRQVCTEKNGRVSFKRRIQHLTD